MVFNDPRRFGFMLLLQADVLDTHPLLAGLGVEPTRQYAGRPLINTLFLGKRTPLKAALLDQRLIAGPRQHLCLRGAVAERAVAAAERGLHHLGEAGNDPAHRSSGRRHPHNHLRRRSKPAGHPCATTSTLTARSAISSIPFKVYCSRGRTMRRGKVVPAR